MSTYKDTDALVELIDYYILYDKDAYKNHSALFIDGMKDGYYRIRSNIINLSTADVAEVVHGEWIKGVCDKCGFDWGKVAPITSVPNYCPNCGAKMDGGKMTNKEAIKILSNRDSFGTPKGYTSGYAEAIDMAIKALSKMDDKENCWTGCESCDRAMEDGECELWGDRMTEECGAWKEKENEFYNRNA